MRTKEKSLQSEGFGVSVTIQIPGGRNSVVWFSRKVRIGKELHPDDMPKIVNGTIEPSEKGPADAAIEDMQIAGCCKNREGKMWFNARKDGYQFRATGGDPQGFCAETLSIDWPTENLGS